MNVQNIEKKEHNVATFEVLVDAAAFDAEVNKAYLRNKKQLYIPGFRKGKAPRAVIEGMYGKDVFYEEAIEGYADTAYAYGVENVDFRIVGRPSLKNYNVNENKELTYVFEVGMYPEVVLGQYKELEVPMDHAEFDEASVDKELQDVRKRNARLLDVERPAQNGDQITLDFDGFVDGERFDGGQADNYDLELGSGSFIPGFEDQLVGAVAGESRDVNVKFPEDYVPELAGKDAVFKCTVKAVREPELPELDDELAKDISDFDTMDEYVAHVREDLKKKFEEDQDSAYATKLMQTAIGNMTVDVPESMVQAKLEEQLDNYARTMGMNQNADRDELLAAMGLDEKTFNTVMRPQAEFEINTELLLDAIVKAEGIEVSDEEFEKAVADMAEEYGMEVDKIKGYLNEANMRLDLARRKAGELIRNTAVDKESEAAGEAPAAE